MAKHVFINSWAETVQDKSNQIKAKRSNAVLSSQTMTNRNVSNAHELCSKMSPMSVQPKSLPEPEPQQTKHRPEVKIITRYKNENASENKNMRNGEDEEKK